MILADRILEGYNAEIQLEYDKMIGLQIIVKDSTIGSIEWVKAADNGKDALDIYKHPFAYGLEL